MNFCSPFTYRLVILGFLTTLLSACINSDTTDLEQFVAEIKKREPPPLTPLPPFPPDLVVLFECAKENPFEDFNKQKSQLPVGPIVPNPEDAQGHPCQQPDIYVNKQPLQKFPLDSLTVVGTITVNGEMFGLIQEPEKKYMVHRVKVNDRLGENYGKIVAITDRQIDIVEMLPIEDDNGACFQEKMRKLDIADSNKSNQ